MESRTEPVTSEPPRGRAQPLERDIDRIVSAQRTSDGAGVRLNRALGGGAPSMLDPFLLLDELIEGAMEHKDSVGNRGRLVSGSAQWMTAGHGIVHSEMPKQERGLMWGFQALGEPGRARAR